MQLDEDMLLMLPFPPILGLRLTKLGRNKSNRYTSVDDQPQQTNFQVLVPFTRRLQWAVFQMDTQDESQGKNKHSETKSKAATN